MHAHARMDDCARTGMEQALKVDLWSPGHGLSYALPISEVHSLNVPAIVSLSNGFIQFDCIRMRLCQSMKPLIQRGVVVL